MRRVGRPLLSLVVSIAIAEVIMFGTIFLFGMYTPDGAHVFGTVAGIIGILMSSSVYELFFRRRR
jgi:hypothetical protein